MEIIGRHKKSVLPGAEQDRLEQLELSESIKQLADSAAAIAQSVSAVADAATAIKEAAILFKQTAPPQDGKRTVQRSRRGHSVIPEEEQKPSSAPATAGNRLDKAGKAIDKAGKAVAQNLDKFGKGAQKVLDPRELAQNLDKFGKMLNPREDAAQTKLRKALTAGEVTQDLLFEYGVLPCIAPPGEKDIDEEKLDRAWDLAGELAEKLTNSGIFNVKQLEALAKQGQLNDVLDCLGVAYAIQEAFDRKISLDKRWGDHPQWPIMSFLMGLSGSFKSMESMCTNYGLVSALVLTMTFANFGSVTNEDWLAYLLRIALLEGRCQDLAAKACTYQQYSENVLNYWYPAYCLGALSDVKENPALNLTNTARDCCYEVITCAVDSSWNVELAFTVGNGGGTAILLLVVLLSAWLYITLNASKANKDRYHEERALVDSLRAEFLVLQCLFIGGMFLAYMGIYAVVCMKATTWGLSWINSLILFTSLVIAMYMVGKLLYETIKINRKIDTIRKAKNSWVRNAVDGARKRSIEKDAQQDFHTEISQEYLSTQDQAKAAKEATANSLEA